MFNIIIGILSLLLFVNLVNGDFEKVALLLGIIVVTNIVKLTVVYQNLSLKYSALEKRFVNLEASLKNDDKTPVVVRPTVQEPIVQAPKEDNNTVAMEIETDKTEVSIVKESDPVEVTKAEAVDETPVTIKTEPKEVSAPKVLPADPIEDAVEWLKNYFMSGNPMVKIGGVILFFGLSFLIKFAFSNDMISVEAGLFSVMAIAIALVITGFKLRDREGSFGLILQGLGIAAFYLVIFSAAKFFAVITLGLALTIMVATIIFATILAILQDSLYLALFATVGGFLSPILTSTGEGSHVMLFSYYALLNVGIVAIAWYKSWRVLNLVGFGFTFIIASLWGAKSYTPENFATTEPFLILFFLLYIAVSVLFTFRTTFKLKGYVDSALVFGVPTAAFGLQAAMAENIEYLLAYTALGMGAIYVLLAFWLRTKKHFSLLVESFFALGVLFLSLVFAFAFAPEISSVIYALESSAIVWISLRQNRRYARYFALALEVYAIASYLYSTAFMQPSEMIFLNNIYLGFFILTIATLLTAFLYEKHKEVATDKELVLVPFLIATGLLLAVYAGFVELHHMFNTYYLLYLTLFTLLVLIISLKTQWQQMQNALELFIPLGLLIAINDIFFFGHPFGGYNAVALIAFAITLYLLLAKAELRFANIWYIAGSIFSVLVLSYEQYFQIEKLSYGLAFALYPLLIMAIIHLIIQKPRLCPLQDETKFNREMLLQGLSAVLMLWQLLALSYSANFTALVYIPLLNPLELMQLSGFALIILVLHSLHIKQSIIVKFAAAVALVMLTVMLARVVHAYDDVSYNIDALAQSALFQTALSVMYTLVALGVILVAKKRQERAIWIGGAALLGVVILKLILVDMARSGSLERIISFLVVGVLILVIGFIAPLPPKKEVQS